MVIVAFHHRFLCWFSGDGHVGSREQPMARGGGRGASPGKSAGRSAGGKENGTEPSGGFQAVKYLSVKF